MDVPSELLAQAGLVTTGAVFPARESYAWQVQSKLGLALLRRLDPSIHRPGDQLVRADLAWLHGFLDRLHTFGFPAPVPIAAFHDTSWVECRGALWELVTFVPGTAVAWSEEPSLTQIGMLLAHYHQVASEIHLPTQRPRAVPLDSLQTAVPRSGELAAWLDHLADDLERIGHRRARRLAIHGDFTAHNVLATTSTPSTVCGVIDFALAYLEAQLADIGFGLWRTGRPRQDAIELAPDRVHAFVSGYARESPLEPAAADAIVTYIQARGIQQAVKGTRAGQPLNRQRTARIRWIHAHHHMLIDVAAQAIP